MSATGRYADANTARPAFFRPKVDYDRSAGKRKLSATGAHRLTGSAGFSLLEVLVVVFIIGVLATMFTLSVGVSGGDRQLDTEVDRLIAVVDLAREEAVIEGREIGLRFYNDSYEFSAFYEDFIDYHDEDNPDQSEWAPLDSSTLLGPRDWPDGLLFELQIDGREVILKGPKEVEPIESTDADEAPVNEFDPQVMIFSSGDMTPFVARIRREFSNTGKSVEFELDGSTEIDPGNR